MFLVPDKVTNNEIKLDGKDVIDIAMTNDLTTQNIGGVCSLVRLAAFPAHRGIKTNPLTGAPQYDFDPLDLKTFVEYAKEAYKGKYFKQAGYCLSKDSAVMAVVTSSQTSTWRLFNEDPFMKEFWTKFHVVSYPKYTHEIAYYICTGAAFWDAFLCENPKALAIPAETPDAAVIDKIKKAPAAERVVAQVA